MSEDRKKLRSLIRLCMNDEYIKANTEDQERKQRRNKATFTDKKKASIDNQKEFEFGDQSGLAFRKGALKALNQDKILFKKIEMHNYVEQVREEALNEIYEFFQEIDPKTAPKNIKLLFFYFVGSRNLLNEMTTESV